jgi:transposase
MIGALRWGGSNTCMSLEGATDTQVFDACVRQVLLPTIRPGEILIMDNLSPHKNEPILQMLAQAGVEVSFLPAYSPDFNPIEKMWSKVKALLRRAEARSPADLAQASGQSPELHHPPGRHQLVGPLWLQFCLSDRQPVHAQR